MLQCKPGPVRVPAVPCPFLTRARTFVPESVACWRITRIVLETNMTKQLPVIADLPVRIGIRRLALTYLDQAESARERLTLNRDGEALHDFRVALRRLRSCLRTYRPYFSDTVRGKHRRAARELAAATGTARDLEVQIAWLASLNDVEPDVAAGARILAERLELSRRPADRAALRAAHQFPALRALLEPALFRYCEEIEREDAPRVVTCAEAASRLAVPAIEELGAALASVETVEDGQAIHEARIAGKRVRYLFEAYSNDAPGGRTAIKKLRRFQDDLGALHDLDVLLGLARSEAQATPVHAEHTAAALAALGGHLVELRSEAFGRIRASWLGAPGRRLVERLREVAASLRPDPAGKEDVEIERKYLLRSMPRLPEDTPVLRVDQGYLPGERLVERVRRVRGQEETRYYRTVKLGSGVRRIEIEEETDEATFRALWRLTKGRRVIKRRHVVRDGERKWEIDKFVGRKLVLAEIELPDETTQVNPPDWLKRRIVREVTGDPKYLNANLAG